MEKLKYNDFIFEFITKDTLKLVEYLGIKEFIEIPGKVENLIVTHIGTNTFDFSRNVRNIIIPASVIEIEEDAFITCFQAIIYKKGYTFIKGNFNPLGLTIKEGFLKYIDIDHIIYALFDDNTALVSSARKYKKEVYVVPMFVEGKYLVNGISNYARKS